MIIQIVFFNVRLQCWLSGILTFIIIERIICVIIMLQYWHWARMSSAIWYTNPDNRKWIIRWTMKIGCFFEYECSLLVSFLILVGIVISHLAGYCFHCCNKDRELGKVGDSVQAWNIRFSATVQPEEWDNMDAIRGMSWTGSGVVMLIAHIDNDDSSQVLWFRILSGVLE